MKQLDVLHNFGIAGWGVLQVGLERGWVTLDDAKNFAINAMMRGVVPPEFI